MKFSKEIAEVDKLCGSGHKGYQYFKNNAVENLEYHQKGSTLIVTSAVKGSGSNKYAVNLTITSWNLKSPKIENSCSCPVGYRCKHVSATFFQLCKELDSFEEDIVHPIENQSIAFESSWSFWLKKCDASMEKKDQGAQKETLFPIYNLHIQNNHASLEIQMTRYLKNGGFKQPSSFHPDRHFSLIKDKDKDVISQIYIGLNSYDRNRYDKKYSLEILKHFSLFKEIVASDRLFLNYSFSHPIKLSDPLELSIEWNPDLDGNVVINFFGNNQTRIQPLPFFEPWYLDEKNLVCGPLITNFSQELILNLLAAPKIPIENITSFIQSSAKIFSMYDITLPKQPIIDNLVEENPKPLLRLFGDNNLTYFSYTTEPMIELNFMYGSFAIPIFENKREIYRYTDDKCFKISRKLQEETKFLKRLLQSQIDAIENIYYPERVKKELQGMFSFQKKDWLKEGVCSHIKTLISEGWKINIDKTFPFQLEIEVDEWYVDLEQINPSNQWFDLELGIIIDKQKISLMTILQQILKTKFSSIEDIEALKDDAFVSLTLENGTPISVLGSRIKPILKMLVELHVEKEGKAVFFKDKAKELSELKHILGEKSIWTNIDQLDKAIQKIQILHEPYEVSPPSSLQANLRPYQQQGLNWLQALREYQFGGILADDMGLGKTLQALTHLLLEKESGRMNKPSIVITPTSLVSNWKGEASKFTPGLKIHVHHGLDRKATPVKFEDYDVIITTYPLLVRDQEQLLLKNFYYVVLDEAQTIKNSHSKATQVACNIAAEYRLCLTGTPIENHLGELWTLFHFLSPGLLGSLKQFNKYFRIPIEKKANASQSSILSKRLAPFILRRIKEDVAKELPPKTEILKKIPLEGAQRDLYEIIRSSMNQKIKQIVEKQGLARSQIIILDALLKMRQVCCDPRLVKLDSANKIKESQKLKYLINFLQSLIEENRRILLFSSFSSMLELIEEECTAVSIPYVKLTGDTVNRAEVIQKFQNLEVPLFLISLKAGGTGLNLTAADTVIHYDPWWNPSAEQQATDRAHRIGQDKPIFVYKLITEGTIEEKILKLQEKKQALIDGLFGEQKEHKNAISLEDLKDLFAPIEVNP